jgi:hypothetical protein
MIYGGFLQLLKLVRFNGGVSYNAQGYAVLPSYRIIPIEASVQPLSMSEIRKLPEGTHYADYVTIDTDYPVDVDNTEYNLGDYFIYQNRVYKIMSSQQFTQFELLPNRQTETTVARDNRLKWDNTTQTINLPYPEIDTDFACFFDFINIVNYVFNTSTQTLTVLWMNQLELRAPFPFCAVNIEKVESLDITTYKDYDANTNNLNTSRTNQLEVSFNFYTYDRLQTVNFMENFKLKHESFQYGITQTQYNNKIGFLGFNPAYDAMSEEVYENRTIFSGRLLAKYSFISQSSKTTMDQIKQVIAQFNYKILGSNAQINNTITAPPP